MSNIKNALDNIVYCKQCNGQGFNGYVSADGDFDFEFCECNPHNILQNEVSEYKELVFG